MSDVIAAARADADLTAQPWVSHGAAPAAAEREVFQRGQLAASMARLVDEVESSRGAVLLTARAVRWTSPAAERCQVDMQTLRARLDACARACRAVAERPSGGPS